MIIQHNMPAANTNRQLGITGGNLQKSTEKLSSGYRINRAGDDAAGLSISEKMRGQIRGLNQASRNAQDGISLIQTAEGAMNEIHSILQRTRELMVQASNGIYTDSDRGAIENEVEQMKGEIERIALSTEFNKKKLLNGDYAEEGITLHVGANTDGEAVYGYNVNTEEVEGKDQSLTFTIGSMRIEELHTADGEGFNAVEDVSGFAADDTIGIEHEIIAANIARIDDSLQYVSDERSKLGSLQNRLEHTIANDDNTAENLQASESRIRDVNMANEMVNYSKNTILQQAAQSMLAQANQQTQGVLALLQ